jgi:transposase
VQAPSDGSIGLTLGACQHDASADRQPLRRLRTPGPLLERATLIIGQCQWSFWTSGAHAAASSVEGFRKFLDRIDASVPPALDVHIILDNSGTHKTPLIHRWLAKRPRFYVHFTPTYGSWLNLVERWFAELTTRQIRRGAQRSVAELERAIQEFPDVHNEQPKPFMWTKGADDILASIARFARRTMAHAH